MFTDMENTTEQKPRKIFKISVIIIILFFCWIIFKPRIVSTVEAGVYKVLQPFPSGKLRAYTEPGMFLRLFGTLWDYKAAGSYSFAKTDFEDNRIEVMFNDGGKAWVTVNVRFILPHNPQDLAALHEKFTSYENVVSSGVKQLVIESIILTASLMTSEESYATKRSLFSEWAWDQVKNGVYMTEQEMVKEVNPITKEESQRPRVKVQYNADGSPKRKESPLHTYKIQLNQFIITEIDYVKDIEDQIATKRKSLMSRIISIAEANAAVQKTATSVVEGERNVIEESYKAEKVKIRAEVTAQKEREVAQINAQRDLNVAKIEVKIQEAQKRAKEFRAQGDYNFNMMKMKGDNALEAKLDILVKVHEFWANAFANSPQAVVSSIILGNEKGSSSDEIMKMLSIKAAKDLTTDKTKKNE